MFRSRPYFFNLTAMENITQSFSYTVCRFEELDASDRKLVEEARQATGTSYSPYSRFRVGAAVLMDNGKTVCGSNQENVAYPSGLCAERCALFYAQSRFPEAVPMTLAIAARQEDGSFTAQPITPCGSCRQVFTEIRTRTGRPMRVLLFGTKKCLIIEDATLLMPFSFDKF